jgi:hypothetical protein
MELLMGSDCGMGVTILEITESLDSPHPICRKTVQTKQ